jgi:hypothetical protein
MAEATPAPDAIPLQFDRVATADGDTPGAEFPSVTCSVCQAPVRTEYYDVNASAVCASCRTTVEAAADTPRGVVPLAAAGALGFGAAIAGAIIYYAVIAIANLEIGIIAILTGYMVGYAVRKGAGGHGGLRFQILAVSLTYFSVALAYTPLAVKGAMAADEQRQQATATQPSASTAPGTTAPSGGLPPVATEATALSTGTVLVSLALMLGLMLALPVLVVAGSFPSGLISALIIFIGMRQAWVMTRAPALTVLGPYRVGGGPSATPA